YILDDADDGWYYVESGKVRGFVKAESLIVGDDALRFVDDGSETAVEIVPYYDNAAFTYTHTTVQDVVVEKIYALAGSDINIYEGKEGESPVIGTLSACGLCYILADDGEWVFVESGDARGFVRKDSLVMGSVAQNKVVTIGESGFDLAKVLVTPEDNSACYYTVTSVDAADQTAILREQVVEYALQFVGNPYVWGGTSLTNGADCSGFVQSIYAHFGYSLPRVAASQSVCSTQIPVSQAEPGDLIFYAEDGYVYHVSLYIGNGQVVHAANSRVGIITSGIWSDAVWAVRII
ncbi:MAG: C40 family peptidase, partial [Lachnospiraceae bacterium]|nr:C40 family peptidase [Lachnospiraceae bacterium]